ncbi:MAG: toll/interleukin-1 receptor domain-containing protein [Gemmatimonadetes bacterium]|nr:toll/interleukin-1 receptor domain-containing protein [Gemmatimonadota bacterium]
MTEQDHLFISYATEDGVLAEWLALRLTAEGYKVWIDRFELLGGEPYPRDIDGAIKHRTFRLIHLVSRHSRDKPNPTKERTLALNLGRERNEDFLIPLNVGGLRATELNWMLSDLTYIPFFESWARGLGQLLKKLGRLNAPKSAVDGPRVAASTFLRDDVLQDTEETLYSNLVPVLEAPDVVHRFHLSRAVSLLEARQLEHAWPHYLLESADGLRKRWYAFAFEPPPELGIPNLRAYKAGGAVWNEVEEIHGMPSWQIVKPLLRKTLHVGCLRRGLLLSDQPSYLFFPNGLLNDDKIWFRSYTGRKTYTQVTGLRRFRGRDQFRYHLGFTFDILRLPGAQLVAKVRVRLRITDDKGNLLPAVSALARRKAITRTWFNHELLTRQLAVLSFLGDGDQVATFGTVAPVKLATTPITLTTQVGINEGALPKGRRLFRYRKDDDEEPAPELDDE